MSLYTHRGAFGPERQLKRAGSTLFWLRRGRCGAPGLLSPDVYDGALRASAGGGSLPGFSLKGSARRPGRGAELRHTVRSVG